jgi:hypothetical protein
VKKHLEGDRVTEKLTSGVPRNDHVLTGSEQSDEVGQADSSCAVTLSILAGSNAWRRLGRARASNQDTQKGIDQRKIYAQSRASRWLSEGNLARHGGSESVAEYCYAKALFWLNRANVLTERESGATSKRRPES